ncbi:MAG: adenine deaminase [Candidatus Heimdallarchaeota archaeon]|nr:MAG: adenine deaminase [Candidatus Heimdallarchaeota archaeon]
MNISFLKELISCARGEIPSDLLIQNGTLVNVITRELYEADIAIYRNRIANVAKQGLLDQENSHNTLDIRGKYVSPGLIESHLHIESTMLPPSEFAKVVVPRGTTTVLLDPHEIGNALGVDGLQLLMNQAEGLPVRFLIEIPSCVPAAPGLETSAHIIDSNTIKELIEKEPRFFGLGEVMNYPGVLFKDDEVLNKIILGSKLNIIDGHSPGVSGNDLDAYIAAGPQSDHESTTPEEFLEKLRKGMRVMAREGSLTKDLRNVLKAVKGTDLDLRNCLIASDDRNFFDHLRNGHLDNHLRIAVEEGISPLSVLQMVTINPATYLGLGNEIGSIAPGKIADIVIFEDLQQFKINSVIFDGKIVFKDEKLNWNIPEPEFPQWAIDTVKLPEQINHKSFRATVSLSDRTYPTRVIGVLSHSVITEALEENLQVKDGWIHPTPEDDILSLTVIERYGTNGNIANAFIKGFDITSKNFAMATTVAHDCHNLIVAGTDHQIMLEAVKELHQIKGGYIVISEDKIQKLPLPYGGLMSTEPYSVLQDQLIKLNNAFQDITEFEEPLMALSFMALPVIPHLKLTDKGLVDVDKFTFTDLIIH